MARIAVVGGGFAGCGAAAAAARAGVEVTLIERSDSLGGLGQAGGSSRMAGQYTAHEEAIAMGAGDIVKSMDAETIFTNIDLPFTPDAMRDIIKDTVARDVTSNLMAFDYGFQAVKEKVAEQSLRSKG